MQPQTIEMRLERLEVRMTTLEQLPARVDALTERVDRIESQLSQFQLEMREGFSAISGQIRAGDEETRRVIGEQIQEKLQEKLDETTRRLNKRIDEKFEEAERHSRVLHEHLLERIKTIGEGKTRSARRKH